MHHIQKAVVIQVVVFAMLIFQSPETSAGVYKCTGPDGRIAYQSKPCTSNTTQSVVKLRTGPASTTQPAAAALKEDPDIVLYSTTWCGYCKKVRKLFDDHNIAYKELDIEQSASARREYDRLNGKGVPLTSINGKLVRGYQPERILNLAKSKT